MNSDFSRGLVFGDWYDDAGRVVVDGGWVGAVGVRDGDGGEVDLGWGGGGAVGEDGGDGQCVGGGCVVAAQGGYGAGVLRCRIVGQGGCGDTGYGHVCNLLFGAGGLRAVEVLPVAVGVDVRKIGCQLAGNAVLEKVVAHAGCRETVQSFNGRRADLAVVGLVCEIGAVREIFDILLRLGQCLTGGGGLDTRGYVIHEQLQWVEAGTGADDER